MTKEDAFKAHQEDVRRYIQDLEVKVAKSNIENNANSIMLFWYPVIVGIGIGWILSRLVGIL